MPSQTRRRRLTVGAAGVIALFLGGCADEENPQPTPAPGQWTGATLIDGSPTPVENCGRGDSMALGSDGASGALATWRANCAVWAARYVAGTGWAAPEVIGRPAAGAWPDWIGDPVLAVNGVGGAIAAWIVWPRAGETHLMVRRWDAASGWAAAERVDSFENQPPSSYFNSAALAMDRAGNALVLWDSWGAGIVAAHLTRGRGWSAPSRLSSWDVSPPTVAFDTSGRAVASWGESGVATLRWFDPERGWGAPSRFPDGNWRVRSRSAMAFDGAGRAVVLWDRDIGDSRFTFAEAVWSAAFDGTRWRDLGRLSPDSVRASGARLGVDSRGRVLGVWAQGDEQLFARFDFATGWSMPQAAGTGVVGPLAMAANGRAILAWTRWDDTLKQGGVQARLWDGSSWSPVQELHATSSYEPSDVSIVIDACGNALGVWTEFDGRQDRVWANRFDAGCVP